MQPILNPKKKISPKLLEKLETDGEKYGMFNKVKLMTSKGPISAASIANGRIA